MRPNSALEDLRETTLKPLSGGLERLDYISGLRDGNGRYMHWGLARIHGESAAEKALAQEHHHLISAVLSAPLRRLLQDLLKTSEVAGISPEAYVARLSDRGVALLPPEPGAGSAKHLSSILRVLSLLAKTQACATLPAA